MLSDIRLGRSPAGQILKLLQQQGSLSIKEIEAALGVTATAVRQQLTMLMTAEMVTAEMVREKRGRPHAVYRLAEKGQALFAQGYEELALALLEEVLHLPDTAHMHQMLHCVSARLGRQVAERMRGTDIANRLQECPYYGLAREHREVCGVEIEAMELALGSTVTLYQSQLDGHNGCQFQVKK